MSRTVLECCENSMRHDYDEHARKAVRMSIGAVRMLKTKRLQAEGVSLQSYPQ